MKKILLALILIAATPKLGKAQASGSVLPPLPCSSATIFDLVNTAGPTPLPGYYVCAGSPLHWVYWFQELAGPLDIKGTLTQSGVGVPATGSVPLTYNAAGVLQTAVHIVEDTGTLVSGTPSAATITLAGSAVFTSNTSYNCAVTNKTTQANPLKIAYTSGSVFVVTGPATVSDAFSFVCVGS